MITCGNRRELNFTKEETGAIAEELVEELREEENGSIRDFVGMLLTLGYGGFMDSRYRDLYPIASEAFHLAKEEGIDFYEFEGKAEKKLLYPPVRKSFIIDNEAAGIKCPCCGSTNTSRFIYGKRMTTEEELRYYPECIPAEHLKNKVEAGKVILRRSEPETVEVNGLRVQTSPRRMCRECGKRFKRNPVYISSDGNRIADYRDYVTEIRFRIEAFGQVGREIVISKHDNGAGVQIRHLPFGKEAEAYRITPDKWGKLLGRLYGWVDLQDWENEYENPQALDGERWDLKVTLDDGNSVEYHGCNAYPPKWQDLVKALNSYAGFGYRVKKHQKCAVYTDQEKDAV